MEKDLRLQGNSTMAHVNPILLVIILNVNGLHMPVEIQKLTKLT